MKKRVVLTVVILASFILLACPSRAILSLNLASNCSLQNIQGLWESILKEPYTNIVTKNLSSCNFESVKYTDASGYDKAWYVNFWNTPSTNRSYVDYGYYEIADPNNNLTLNISDYQRYTTANFGGGYLFSYLGRTPKNRTSPVDTFQKTMDESTVYFKFDASSPTKWTETGNLFSFGEGTQGNVDGLDINKNLTKSEGQISRNLSISNPTDCTPSWTAHNATCQSNDKKTQYFTDLNSCGQNMSNLTLTCDYDSNGVMGSLTNLTSISTLAVYINSSTNLTRTMSGSQKIEFKAQNYTLVEFSWDFSQALNLDKIHIEKQSSSASRGYLLINGIPINKKIQVQKLTNSTKICARNAELNSISDLTLNCAGSSEMLIDCPSTVSGISCSVNGSYFIVNGLTNSAVREVIIDSSGNCTTSWNCTAWTNCTNRSQTRNCTDLNNCSTTSGRPSLNQSCSPPTPLCNPSWLCENWTACSKEGTKARICRDRRNCNATSNNKKTETDDCEYREAGNLKLWIVIGIIVMIIVVVIILIAYLLKKKPEDYAQIPPPQSPVTQFGYAYQQGN